MTSSDSSSLAELRVAILVASDKGARGERADQSGLELQADLEGKGARVTERIIVADDQSTISEALIRICDSGEVDLVLTCGGTGFTSRDVTPEATSHVVERPVPGIPEAMRAASLSITPKAMLSRGTAGIRGRTLIVNLPGSPKAVRENMAVLFPVLPHAMETLRSTTGVDCGAAPSRPEG